MLLIFWVIYIYYLHIACHLQIMFYFFLSNLFFHYFLCFNTLDNTFSKIMNKNGGSRDPCFISDLRSNAFNISSTRDLLYIFKKLFIYLAALSLSCSMWDLHCITRDVSLQCRFSSCDAWVSAVGLQYSWYMVLVAPQHVRY